MTRDEPHLLAGFLNADCGRAQFILRKTIDRIRKEYIYYKIVVVIKKYGKSSGCSPHTIREDIIVPVILYVKGYTKTN